MKKVILAIAVMSIFLFHSVYASSMEATVEKASVWKYILTKIQKAFAIYPSTAHPGEEITWYNTLKIECPYCMNTNMADLYCILYNPNGVPYDQVKLSWWSVTCDNYYTFSCRWTVPSSPVYGTWKLVARVTKSGDYYCVLAQTEEYFNVQPVTTTTTTVPTTTTTTSTTTTTIPPVCNNNGICETYLGENPSNCPNDCKVLGNVSLIFLGIGFAILFTIALIILK